MTPRLLCCLLLIFSCAAPVAQADPEWRSLPHEERKQLREQMREAWKRRDEYHDEQKALHHRNIKILRQCRKEPETVDPQVCLRHEQLREDLRRSERHAYHDRDWKHSRKDRKDKRPPLAPP